MHDATSPCLPGLRQGGALGSDATHPLVPGIDAQLGPFVLEPYGHSIDVDGEPSALPIPWETHTALCLQAKRCRGAQRGRAGHPAVACTALENCQWGLQDTYHSALTHDDDCNSLSKKVYWTRGSVAGGPCVNVGVRMGSQLPADEHVCLRIGARGARL